ncbi:hypothetical protein ES703_101442 [subsurface metagenome]
METVWFIRNIEGTYMKTVNLPFIYQLGAEMQELMKLEYKGTGTSRFDVLIASNPVSYSIRRLLIEYPALTVSRKPGEDMLTAIGQVHAWKLLMGFFVAGGA